MVEIKMLVDFFFVGPSKTASTWIYKALDEHPDFSLPTSKDIYFFDQFYDKGYDWYNSQFQNCDQNKLIGEFSHDYLMNKKALSRIENYNPKAKLIVCIRNPFERTESGIKFLRRNGYGFGTIEELTKKHAELINGSLYGHNLEVVYELFPRENVLLLDFEQLQNDPSSFLRKIYEFFGVDYYEPEILNRIVNKAKAARFRTISLLVKKVALLARRLGFGNFVGKLKMNPVLLRILYKDKGDNTYALSRNDREYLAKFFNEDIDKLSKLTGRNYNDWIFI